MTPTLADAPPRASLSSSPDISQSEQGAQAAIDTLRSAGLYHLGHGAFVRYYLDGDIADAIGCTPADHAARVQAGLRRACRSGNRLSRAWAIAEDALEGEREAAYEALPIIEAAAAYEGDVTPRVLEWLVAAHTALVLIELAAHRQRASDWFEHMVFARISARVVAFATRRLRPNRGRRSAGRPRVRRTTRRATLSRDDGSDPPPRIGLAGAAR